MHGHMSVQFVTMHGHMNVKKHSSLLFDIVPEPHNLAHSDVSSNRIGMMERNASNKRNLQVTDSKL
jgi:hypothetical protein